jgi:hypothetical protein
MKYSGLYSYHSWIHWGYRTRISYCWRQSSPKNFKKFGGRGGGGYILPFLFGFGIFYLSSSSPWDGSCPCFHQNHWFDVFMVVTFNHPKLKVIMTPYHSVPNFTTQLTPWWWSSTNVLSSCIIKTTISFFLIQKILHSLGKRDQFWCTWFVLMKVGSSHGHVHGSKRW